MSGQLFGRPSQNAGEWNDRERSGDEHSQVVSLQKCKHDGHWNEDQQKIEPRCQHRPLHGGERYHETWPLSMNTGEKRRPRFARSLRFDVEKGFQSKPPTLLKSLLMADTPSPVATP